MAEMPEDLAAAVKAASMAITSEINPTDRRVEFLVLVSESKGREGIVNFAAASSLESTEAARRMAISWALMSGHDENVQIVSAQPEREQ